MTADIRHMVAFKLAYPKDDPRTAAFLADARRILGRIPGVKNFLICREVSKKNGFDFGFSFDFTSAEDYEKYNLHPDHQRFVEERWKVEVADFMEIDFAGIAS